ncbi:MAG TPA: hypothetical protein VIF60_16355 [Burkholderiaceae bacterium]|jgi:hypothetical protein
MTEKQYFLCDFHLDGMSRVVIWYTDLESDNGDGLLLDGSNTIATFTTLDSAHNFALARSIAIEDQDPSVYDFDAIARWSRTPHVNSIDCIVTLDAWNMLHDVVSSVDGVSEFRSMDARMEDIYYKIFFGCNLASMTPEGEQFNPKWDAEEIDALVGLLACGVRELRTALGNAQ